MTLKIHEVNLEEGDEQWAAETIAALGREEAKGNLDVAGANDRAWFEANPTRRYRLRAPLAGEHFHFKGDLGRNIATIVFLGAPGMRFKLQCRLTAERAAYPDDEATAKQLWMEGERMYPELRKVRKAFTPEQKT